MNDMANIPKKPHTFRLFKDGENMWTSWDDLTEKIFQADHSYKCPTYVQRAPPCQGSCPSGHDIRGWLMIARQMDKPPVAVRTLDSAAAPVFLSVRVTCEPFEAIETSICSTWS